MKLVWIILAAALLGCAIPVAYELTLLLQSARIDMDQLKDEYIGVALPAKKALADISAASLVIAQIGAKERNAFDAQQAYYVELGKQTTALLGEANASIREFNSKILPSASVLLGSGADLLSSGRRSVDTLSDAAGDDLRGVGTAVAAIQQDAVSARPGIDQLSGTAEELHGSATDFHAWTHRELAPARGVWHTFKEILNLVFEGRGAVGF